MNAILHQKYYFMNSYTEKKYHRLVIKHQVSYVVVSYRLLGFSHICKLCRTRQMCLGLEPYSDLTNEISHSVNTLINNAFWKWILWYIIFLRNYKFCTNDQCSSLLFCKAYFRNCPFFISCFISSGANDSVEPCSVNRLCVYWTVIYMLCYVCRYIMRFGSLHFMAVYITRSPCGIIETLVIYFTYFL